MNKAVFIDRDGVINVDYGYVYEVDKFEFIPGVLDALKMLAKTDFKVVIITDQSGIGRGYYKEKDYHKLTKHMMNLFRKQGIRIDGVYYCPHSPEAGCKCRKPGIGMLEKAKNEMDIDFKKSYIIGDKTKDIKCGENAGCKTILVRTGKGGCDREHDVNPDFTANDLKGAVGWIIDNEKSS